MARTKDLTSISSDKGVKWNFDDPADSLNKLYEKIVGKADDTVSWYQDSKKSKKFGAITFRIFAICLGAIAGVIPVLIQIFQSKNPAGEIWLQPAFASVALAVAAFLIILDRFLGFSAGWMRYVKTFQVVNILIDNFKLDWEIDSSSWTGGKPTPAQVQATLIRFKTFVQSVNEAVQSETNQWAQEFQSIIAQLDESAKTPIPVYQLGAVNVTVTNGELSLKGWFISLDSSPKLIKGGKTCAINNIVPGNHVIQVSGEIGGKAVQDEKVVTVTSGGAVEVSFTLV